MRSLLARLAFGPVLLAGWSAAAVTPPAQPKEGPGGAEAYIVARGELEVRRQVNEDSDESLLLARLAQEAAA